MPDSCQRKENGRRTSFCGGRTPDAHGPVQRVNTNNYEKFQVIPNGQPTGEHGCARVNQRVVSTGEAPDLKGLRHPHG